jgi:hypothetical protein
LAVSRLQLALERPLAILALLVIRSHRRRALPARNSGDGERVQLDHLFAVGEVEDICWLTRAR